MTTPAANQQHVLDYLDAIRRGDHARAIEAFHEDATWTTPPTLPWPGFFRGRKAIFEEYFAVDKGLFTFASYNAGPGRIRQLRREAQKRGLNPNIWFGNVERIASERIGRETVTYVSNIYKYYVAYKLISAENDRRKAAKQAIEKSSQ